VLFVHANPAIISTIKHYLQPFLASKQGRMQSVGEWTRIHTLDADKLGFSSVTKDPSEARIMTKMLALTLAVLGSVVAIVILLNYSNFIVVWLSLFILIVLGVPIGLFFLYNFLRYMKRGTLFVDVLFDRRERIVRIKRRLKEDVLNFEAVLNIHVVNPVRHILTFGSIPIFISAEVAQVTKMEHLIRSFIQGKPLKLETVDLDTLGES
jgi:hypothetical protein